MYRIGFPGWKLAARLGVPLLLRIEVASDDAAGVYTATSPDLRGLVAESVRLADLFSDVCDCVDMLLEAQLKYPLKKRPRAVWSGAVAAA